MCSSTTPRYGCRSTPWLAPASLRAASRRLSATGSSALPTLLDLAGLPIPERLDGRSLKLALEGRPMNDEAASIESLLSQRQFGWAPLRGMRDARWKYIDAPEPELAPGAAGRRRVEEPCNGSAATDRDARRAARGEAEGRGHAKRPTARDPDGLRSGGAASCTGLCRWVTPANDRRHSTQSRDGDRAH